MKPINMVQDTWQEHYNDFLPEKIHVDGKP